MSRARVIYIEWRKKSGGTFHSLLLLNLRTRIFICASWKSTTDYRTYKPQNEEWGKDAKIHGSETLWKINVKSLWLWTNYEKIWRNKKMTLGKTNECNYFSIFFSSFSSFIRRNLSIYKVLNTAATMNKNIIKNFSTANLIYSKSHLSIAFRKLMNAELRMNWVTAIE